MPGDEMALSKLIANLAMEVFQRRPHSPNKPLDFTSHNLENQGVSDDARGVLITATNTTIWGPGGASDQVDATPSSARWDGAHNWA